MDINVLKTYSFLKLMFLYQNIIKTIKLLKHLFLMKFLMLNNSKLIDIIPYFISKIL